MEQLPRRSPGLPAGMGRKIVLASANTLMAEMDGAGYRGGEGPLVPPPPVNHRLSGPEQSVYAAYTPFRSSLWNETPST